MDRTAANILASLGVKGATVDRNLPGYIPVLGEDGKLAANLIPANAAQIAIPTLSNLVCVDPYTTVAEGLRKGSVAAPFKSLTEAAENFIPTADARDAQSVAFLLLPGKYTDSWVQFPSGRAPLNVAFIGIGKCLFASTRLVISGLSNADGLRPSVLLQGIRTNGEIAITAIADVVVLGNAYIDTLNGLEGTALRLSSESRVSSTNAGTVSYLSEDVRVGNTSTVAGATVGDALSRLDRRRIRIARIASDSSWPAIDSSSPFVDVEAGSSGSDDIYDLTARDRLFVDCIKRLNLRFKHIVSESVTARTVVADTLEVGELKMNALALGGYNLTVDAYGYLVVHDGSEEPPRPPEHVFRLMDSVTGAVYILGVANGRLYILEDDTESSSDSSSSDVPETLTVFDPESGYTYAIALEDGRLVISRIGG